MKRNISRLLSILPFKCYDDKDDTDLDNVVRAIYSAVDDYDCDIINLSLGVEKDVTALRGSAVDL